METNFTLASTLLSSYTFGLGPEVRSLLTHCRRVLSASATFGTPCCCLFGRGKGDKTKQSFCLSSRLLHLLIGRSSLVPKASLCAEKSWPPDTQ